MNFLWIVGSILLLHKHTFAEERFFTFSEGCPKDSILTNGVCKCDHSLCDKPICMSVLKLVTDFTEISGSCCPTYSCEGCKKSDRLDGHCPCAKEAILKSGRECTCIDHHKKLVNNTCICDEGKCELPDLCDDRSVAVKEMDGCCEKTKCIPCPDDSYVTSYNDDAIEDKCVCIQCPAKICNETHIPHILQRGKNIPGMCCDIYKCVSTDSNMGCLVNGTVYSKGETWISGDNICVCKQNGISYCSIFNPTSESHGYRPCLSGVKVYNHLDTWLLEDGCTNCTCYDGIPKCIAHMCDIYTSEMKKSAIVCPPLSACHKECTNGYKIDKLGCEMCQCKGLENLEINLDQYYQFHELLKEYNLTESDVIDFIKTMGQSGSLTDATSVPSRHYVSSSSTLSTKSEEVSSTYSTVRTTVTSSSATSNFKSTITPLSTICKQNNHALGNCAYSCLLEYALPGFVIGTVLGTILVLMFRKCLEKNRKKYSMYMPVGKDATIDKNLNISAIIKQNTKPFELQSYNEKKNAI